MFVHLLLALAAPTCEEAHMAQTQGLQSLKHDLGLTGKCRCC